MTNEIDEFMTLIGTDVVSQMDYCDLCDQYRPDQNKLNQYPTDRLFECAGCGMWFIVDQDTAEHVKKAKADLERELARRERLKHGR